MAHGAGLQVPDLPAWRGIERRLLLGTPKRVCGAGQRLLAVTTDERLVPCYRFAFEPGDAHVLGTLAEGVTDPALAARFASVDPDRLRPEGGDCSTCEAVEGCTHVCPAQGWLALGDPAAVPAVTCDLIRVQVDVIRRFVTGAKRFKPASARAGWAAAAMVAAVAAFGVAACGGNVDAAEDQAHPGDAGVDGADAEAPGVCPVQVDASEDVIGPGQCPVQVDASEDVVGPGQCPVQVDASEDVVGPGQCPVQVDASQDVDGPGLCPVQVDASDDVEEDVMGPGLCPYVPDASDDGPPPGLC